MIQKVSPITKVGIMTLKQSLRSFTNTDFRTYINQLKPIWNEASDTGILYE